ncbi:MAG: hypothetical protein ACYTG0_36460 [Planctomycetota bacterium]
MNHAPHIELAVAFVLAIGMMIVTSVCAQADPPARVETRSGILEYDVSGYPTRATVDKIFDELAYHGATQAYLWGTAILVNEQWRQANLSVAGPLDFVTYNNVKEKYNIITSNMATPYMVAFPNLKESGPLILEIPAGPTGGILNDIEHRPSRPMFQPNSSGPSSSIPTSPAPS